MTIKRAYTTSDLRTIVPASTPAWIRIIEAYQVLEDDESITKEWIDEVIPVLAYATLPSGNGAFLIYDNNATYTPGPTWCTPHDLDFDLYKAKLRVELSVGTPPIKGVPCAITEGHVYVNNEESPMNLGEVLMWVL